MQPYLAIHRPRTCLGIHVRVSGNDVSTDFSSHDQHIIIITTAGITVKKLEGHGGYISGPDRA